MYKKVLALHQKHEKEQTSINTLRYNGETHTDSEAKANALNNQFVSVLPMKISPLFLISPMSQFLTSQS